MDGQDTRVAPAEWSGDCEAWLDDGRVLRGTLSPTRMDRPALQLWAGGAAGMVELPLRSLQLLRLLSPKPGLFTEQEQVRGRPFLLDLARLDTRRAWCVGLHVMPDGGQWLDVRLISGEAQAWYLPLQALGQLHWGAAAGVTPSPSPQSIDELWERLQHQPARRVSRLGEALVERGLIGVDTLSTALKAQRHIEPHRLIGQMLVDAGSVSQAQLGTVLSEWMGIPVVDLRQLQPEPAALARLPRAMAEREGVLPLAIREDALVIAVPDPWDRPLLDSLRFACDLRIVPVSAHPGTLAPAIARAYAGATAAQAPAKASARGSSANGLSELAAELSAGAAEEEESGVVSESDNTLVRMINAMITEAIRLRASDIHIETGEPPRPVRVRMRVDGNLIRSLDLPARLRYAVVGRLKIMADLDISEHRKPQDGKIAFARFGGPKVELRMVTVPTQHGLEDVVLRLLSGLKPLPLDGIGLSRTNLDKLRLAMSKPYGLILVCGPTGSGKTTTLHSIMRELNTDERKIWTAEDPVEITQEGLRQVQVNARIGWTFAAAMRTFLRADPDIIMIGEMRDEETARIAVEASLTGHLVMSTLHTNSAPESITRLLEIGLDPFMFSDSLLAIVAQRLVRRLCKHCRERETLSDDALRSLARQYVASGAGHGPTEEELIARGQTQHANPRGEVVIYRRRGCDHCENSGYHGRLGLHELMTSSEPVRELIRHRSPAARLQAAALDNGMVTLRQDGIEKVLAGLTDLAEVLTASND